MNSVANENTSTRSDEYVRKTWKRRIILAAFFALLFKALLAWFSPGTQDILTWERFVKDMRQVGPLGLYHQPYVQAAALNYAPFILHFLQALSWFCDVTGLPLRFCLRLLVSLSDVGSLILLWQFLQLRLNLNPASSPRETFSKISFSGLLFYAGTPVLVLISGFHGNIDSIMMFFVLLSLWFLERKMPIWMVGIAFGMSLNIKVASLIFLPVFLLYLKTPRRQIKYSIAVIATFVLAGMPYLAQEPSFILHRVFGYGGQYGTWGISFLVRAFYEATGIKSPNDFFFEHGKNLLLVLLISSSILMNRRPRKPDILRQCALIALIFFAFTPSFGVQYLAWLVPLILCLGTSATTIFNVSVTPLLVSNYILLWYLSTSRLEPPAFLFQALIVTKIICWSSILMILVFEIRKLSRDLRVDSSHENAQTQGEFSKL